MLEKCFAFTLFFSLGTISLLTSNMHFFLIAWVTPDEGKNVHSSKLFIILSINAIKSFVRFLHLHHCLLLHFRIPNDKQKLTKINRLITLVFSFFLSCFCNICLIHYSLCSGRQSSPYQEVTIYRNYFTRNRANYTDVIILRQVVSNFTHNYVHRNTGLRILEVSGFHKVRLPIYQTTSHNGFYRWVSRKCLSSFQVFRIFCVGLSSIEWCLNILPRT